MNGSTGTHENPGGDLREDPRLTAFALGELPEAEAREIEEALAASESLQAEVEAIRQTAQALTDGWSVTTNEEPDGLDASRRDAILAAPARWKTRRVVVALAAAAVLLVAIGSLWKSSPQFRAGLEVGSAADSAPARRSSPGGAPRATGRSQSLSHLGYGGKSGSADGSLRGLGYQGEVALEALGYGGGGMVELGYAAGDPDLSAMGYLGYGDQESSNETYAPIQENPFRLVRDEPLSTFSIDVDTASYANVRRHLTDGRLPPPDAVRIEELVNYFPYDDPAPRGDVPFATRLEVADCPWRPEHKLVRIGLKGRPIEGFPGVAKNLVFLLDVSGSMNGRDKLPLLKRSLRLLVAELTARDRVSIVVYAGASGVVLPPTEGVDKERILEAIERLDAGGSTNGGAGIELAYRLAEETFLRGGINRVLLATDGDFNVGVSSDEALVELSERKRESGVVLSVLGFGTGNLKDAKMEQLADHGNGNYSYIDSLAEARKVLVNEMGGTLEAIAKDVKLQVEFNPGEVAAFRLIGYENRILDHQDFDDDTKDAGEIGAGHTVTALYELVPAGASSLEGIELKYQDASAHTPEALPKGEAHAGELLTVKLRYKDPEGSTSRLLEVPLEDADRSFASASRDLRFAASVAAFGMLLRGSAHAGSASWDAVLRWSAEAIGSDPFGYRTEFLRLVERAEELSR